MAGQSAEPCLNCAMVATAPWCRTVCSSRASWTPWASNRGSLVCAEMGMLEGISTGLLIGWAWKMSAERYWLPSSARKYLELALRAIVLMMVRPLFLRK